MTPINQFERGILNYIDNQVLNRMPSNSVYKILLGTSVAIVAKKAHSAAEQLKSNPVVSALGLIDENDMVDSDMILEELRNQIPDEGLKIETNKFGRMNMTFTKCDIDEVKRYILRG